MIFWLVVVLLVLHLILAFFMSPPTAWADRFFNMFATHPRLKDENISEITVHDVALRGERKAEFVEAFNNANFLYDGGVIKDLSENPIRVRFTQGRTSFAFEMYLYGEQMIEIVRIKNKKYLPYRVRSASLENFLMSLSTIQTSSAN